MKIEIGSAHAGFKYKEAIKKSLTNLGTRSQTAGQIQLLDQE
jgi:ribose 5-phosphate isomerase RpiB